MTTNKATAKPIERQLPEPTRKPPERIRPALSFTPYAWAKLHWFCYRGNTEIGAFGISAPHDLLLVADLVTVKQNVSVASVSFDDEAVADFFDEQVDAGRKPEQFSRIWLHTHPGDSPSPSGTDEETFCRVFGGCDWAVMCILAQGGKTYARLRFNVGPKGETALPVAVDYDQPFARSEHDAWAADYAANVTASMRGWCQDGFQVDGPGLFGSSARAAAPDCFVPDDWLEELEGMEPAERQLVLDELAARPDLWGEQEVPDDL